jgi:hypothetical protein
VASLSDAAYDNKPQFAVFRSTMTHPPKPLATFGPAEYEDRLSTVSELMQKVWSPSRLRSIIE